MRVRSVGMNLGDKTSRYCMLDENGEVLGGTTKKAMTQVFATMKPCRVAIEVGTHSPWVSRLLKGFGHEVIVVNARQAQLISNSSRKNDRMDAQMLARLVRVDPRLLRSVQHRSEQAQEHLRVIRCAQPAGLQNWLRPLLEEVESLTQKIQALDQQVEQIARTDYPGTSLLRQVSGVGPLIALTFVLTVEDRERFQKSRDVGCYVGLRSRQSDSGESEPQLRITKEGDPCLRKLLDSNTHKEAQICPVLDDEEIRQASERREVEGDQPRGGWRTQAGSMVRRFAGAFESRRCVKSITNSVARLCRRGA